MNKNIYLGQHSKGTRLQSQTRLLKAAESHFLNTQACYSWLFLLQQPLLQTLGKQLSLIRLQARHNAF